MRRVLPAGILAVSLLSLLTACPAPHTRSYQPVSSWEKQALDRANRNVFPDDIRSDLTRYRNTLIAWPGVVLGTEFVEQQDKIEIQFVLEHHYYDWLEDFSIQREKIFLSPRG